jgi:hypothetical protein
MFQVLCFVKKRKKIGYVSWFWVKWIDLSSFIAKSNPDNPLVVVVSDSTWPSSIHGQVDGMLR